MQPPKRTDTPDLDGVHIGDPKASRRAPAVRKARAGAGTRYKSRTGAYYTQAEDGSLRRDDRVGMPRGKAAAKRAKRARREQRIAAERAAAKAAKAAA